ncbi:hypothetical protein CL656_06135 [bacterium]|nr:hypothetical protein [bacterium]|tara:strand:+ start:2023 stop:2310 length:288 start_codon:yes stop_codon:yes gene_type:complete
MNDNILERIYNLCDDLKKIIYDYYLSLQYLDKKKINNHIILYSKIKNDHLYSFNNSNSRQINTEYFELYNSSNDEYVSDSDSSDTLETRHYDYFF